MNVWLRDFNLSGTSETNYAMTESNWLDICSEKEKYFIRLKKYLF
jgi:hypothetical protein